MTYADDYNIRDLDNATLGGIANAIDALFTSAGPFEWTTYTVNGAVAGGGSISSTISNGRFAQVGDLVIANVLFYGTTSGTVTHFTFDAPVQPTLTVYFACICLDGSTSGHGNIVPGVCYIPSTGVTGQVWRYDNANFGAAAGTGFSALLAYRV